MVLVALGGRGPVSPQVNMKHILVLFSCFLGVGKDLGMGVSYDLPESKLRI